MSFPVMRLRATELLNRFLEQLEAKEELSLQDIAGVEKLVKTVEILDEAEARTGKANPNAGKSTEELEDEFE